MKRIWQIGLVLMVLVAVPALSANAQMPIKFGIKGGLDMANLTGDDVEDTDMKLGFGGGLFAQFSFENMPIVIQPEVMYVMKGAKDSEDGDYKIKLDYIEIPVLVKYNIPMEGNMTPCIFAGPAFGINMSAKVDDGDDSYDIYNKKSMDIGLAFGAGLDMAMGQGKLTFDVRYTLGLTKVLDDVEQDESVPVDEVAFVGDLDGTTYSAPDVKNANISFFIGYMF